MDITFYFLRLNDMRGCAENGEYIASSFEREKLVEFVNAFMVDPYTDEPSVDFYGREHTFRKYFAKGSILEWYNLPYCPITSRDMFGHGIVECVAEHFEDKDISSLISEIKANGILFLE